MSEYSNNNNNDINNQYNLQAQKAALRGARVPHGAAYVRRVSEYDHQCG